MYKIGIDIGGTKIRGVLADGKNKIVARFNIETPKDKKIFLPVLKDEVEKFLRKGKIVKIGVGLPGIVDVGKGKLIKAPNLPNLNGWQAKSFFVKFCKNVKIDNDSRCFLLAESRLGAGRGYKNIVGIAIGTGIGGAIMINGKIQYGSNFSAGELGHMILDDHKTLEELAGKSAYEQHGDRSEFVGIGAASVINILNPEIVILGGGAVAAGKVDIGIVRKSALSYIMSPLAKKTPIVKAKLGKEAQAIGATLL